jgi:urease accessory protein
MDRAGVTVHLVHPVVLDPPRVSQSRSAAAAFEEAQELPREFVAYLSDPLDQRPAGSVGKRGTCALSFAVDEGKTFLQYSFVTHPFHLTRPWYLDPTLPGMAVVYVQTPAGGLIQGDRANLRCTLGPGAQVHLTTQAAEKIHTMTANCALQQVSFILSAGAYIEYCPEPVILFSGSRYGQELRVELGAGASFFGTEIFLIRNAADGAFFDALATGVSVQDADGTLVLRDRSLVLPAHQGLAGLGVLGPYQVWGQALLIGPSTPSIWAREVHTVVSAEPEVICGVTVLPWERGVGIKAVGAEVRAVRRVLHAAWYTLRMRYLGVAAPQFPK